MDGYEKVEVCTHERMPHKLVSSVGGCAVLREGLSLCLAVQLNCKHHHWRGPELMAGMTGFSMYVPWLGIERNGNGLPSVHVDFHALPSDADGCL